MEIFKQGEAELQFEDDRKNETITLTMDPVKGKVVYNANCLSCHNNDPKKQGSIDPQIYFSSKELLLKKLIMENIQRITDQKGLEERCYNAEFR